MRRFGLSLALVAAAIVSGGPGAAASHPTPFIHRHLLCEGVPVEVLEIAAGARVWPVAETPGRTVLAYARQAGALAAINGGFFNHSDGQAVSHVRSAGRSITRPESNRALLGNRGLAPLLPLIWNRRVEWRKLALASGQPAWAIAPHDAPVPAGGRVVDALQAGPRLLPALGLVAEGFVTLDRHGAIVRDGVASRSRAARSGLGLTADGRMLWVAAGAKGRGLSLAQLAGCFRRLHATEAMGLDGGSSTTLVWRSGRHWRTVVGSGGAAARVNSALLLSAP